MEQADWDLLFVGLLCHNLHLVVLDNATSLPLDELMVCDLLMCNICIFSYMSCYMLLCRRVCNVPVVPQVSIFVLYIDSYASVYGTIGVLRSICYKPLHNSFGDTSSQTTAAV